MTETDKVHVRELGVSNIHLRELPDGTREFTGIAVPWDTDAHIRDWFGDYYERFERGAVQDSDDALIFWRHDEPIGKLVRAEDVDEGWQITGRLSDTPRGNEGYQLLKDGVITELSIGFIALEWREADEDGKRVLIRTKVHVREISLVPFGAFGQSATVSQVREAAPHPDKEGTPDMAETLTRADLSAELESFKREVSVEIAETLASRGPRTAPLDTRSPGEILKALAAGDATTIEAYEALYRDGEGEGEPEPAGYTGGTSEDTISKPGWVGDLTRLFDSSSGVLSSCFATGTLPETGMQIEFGELDENTIDVTKQDAEGDPITFGNVKLTTRSADVETYAGGTELSRQEIERSSVNILDAHLRAMTIAAAARKKAVLRAAYNSVVSARTGISGNGGVVLLGAQLNSATAANWEAAIVDAAIKYEALNLTVEGLVVSSTVFKKLAGLTVSGERVFQTGPGNASGVLDLPGLRGDFAGIPVLLDSGQSGDAANFVNRLAIRQYDSPLVQLTDDRIVTLSRAYAVYRYGAVAAEIPAAIVPVKLAAS